jgi:hypothetical protein
MNCRHAGCMCEVPDEDESYCGGYCRREAADAEHEIEEHDCWCGHPACEAWREGS